MNILIINLPEATDRLNFQRMQMKRLGLDFEIVTAVEGQSIDPVYYQKMRTTGMRILSHNEVGCFLSHLECWQRCVESNQPTMVFEDDAVIGNVLPHVLTDFLTMIPDGPSILSLEFFSTKKRVSKRVADLNNGAGSIYNLAFAGAGAAAYIIWPKAAKLCLEKARKQISLADIFLYSIKGTHLYQIVPALVMQLGVCGHEGIIGNAASSTINSAGSRRATSLQSFIANPMTRVRRIQSWLLTVWARHIVPVENTGIHVTAHHSVLESLAETKRLLKWLS
jgi:glycosyl transferase, family 25